MMSTVLLAKRAAGPKLGSISLEFFFFFGEITEGEKSEFAEGREPLLEFRGPSELNERDVMTSRLIVLSFHCLDGGLFRVGLFARLKFCDPEALSDLKTSAYINTQEMQK